MTTPVETFRKNGYLVFPDLLTADELATLREACDNLLDEPLDDGGGKRHKIGLGEARRFLAHRHEDFPDLDAFLFSNTIDKVVSDTLATDQSYLFNEQFVVKGAGKGASFAWHQDSAYVGYDHPAYLTIWIALDDATEENGCVYILPRDLDEKPGIDHHEWVDDSRELNGYFGDEPGLPMTCTAGTVVAFSSRTLHRSGANVTNARRRAYICQYVPEPIRDPKTGEVRHFAKPLRAA